jgi:5-methylcytosine-specific restriction endonuclease McrA
MGKNNHTDARAVAKSANLATYETGIPCTHGHTAPRRTINGRCLECEYNYNRSEAAKQRDREKYRKNPEAVAARSRKWRLANRARSMAAAIASEHNARAKRAGVEGRLTCDEVLDVLAIGACGVCSSEHRLTIDHIVSMTRGGPNTRANLQALCLNCNSQKHTSEMDVFLARRKAA